MAAFRVHHRFTVGWCWDRAMSDGKTRSRLRTPAKQLQEVTNLSKTQLTKVLSRLEEVDAIEILPTGEVIINDEAQQEEAAAAATLAQERRQQLERSRLEMMRGYAEVRNCRRQYLLNYFGESLDEPCGFYDNCKAGVIVEENSNLAFPINSTVIHTNFGKGRVLGYEGDKIVVLFDKVGYKTFALELAQGLLKQLEYKK